MLREKYNQYSFILDRTARKVKQYAQMAFAENQFDITVDQWTALKTIFEHPNLSNKDLAEHCGKDQPTLTRIIDLLIKKGLVKRIAHPSDRRSLRLRVTTIGASKIKEIAPRVADFRMQAWQNLDEKDFEHFVRILDTIYQNLTLNQNKMIHTDLCIIGAGPVGLFAVFEAGLLKMRCHLIDALPQVGGQLSEIYPHKPIYDIPGYPVVKAQELIDNQMEQIKPFSPTFTLGERVERLEKQVDGSYIVETSEGTQVHCQAVAIAGGLGSFEPRKPELEGLEFYERKGVDYMVKNPEIYSDKKIIIAGGGDSALDWTIYLSDIAKEVTLVHRSDSFRGAPDSADKVFELAQQGKINLLLSHNLLGIEGDGTALTHIKLSNKEKQETTLEADYLIPLYGLTPKLGPIADWGLNIDKSAIEVNTFDYSTNVERIYAIGDINTYPGKLKLILCGYHEATLMVQSAFKYVYPKQKLSFKYTTVNGVHSF